MADEMDYNLYGSWCPKCNGYADRTGKTPTSIHGRCLECGFQKFDSVALGKKADPLPSRPKGKFKKGGE